MDRIQAVGSADYIVWVGNDALYIWDSGERRRERIDLRPREEIPYVPKFYAVWEGEENKRNGVPCQKMFTSALGGRLRVRMSRIVMAVPDDIVWVEKQALTDFALMAGAGAPGKKLFFRPQSEMLRGSEERRYIGVTWSSRCLSACLVRDGVAERKIHLDIVRSGPEELSSAVEELSSGERLPVYYPGIEEAPLPLRCGTAVPPGQIDRQ